MSYLPPTRDRPVRFDTAQALTRLFYREQAAVLACGGWIPRVALLVYHGGIGTLAQAIKAGIPHLVVPNGHDQFDNGWRIEQLGLGRSIPQSAYRAQPVVTAIKELLDDGDGEARRQDFASRIDSDASIARACDLIEALRPRERMR